MKILEPNTENTIKRLQKPAPRILSIAVKFALVIVILIGGFAVSAWIKNSAPTAQKRPPEITAPYVEVMELTPADRQISIEIFGTVTPQSKVELKAGVAGEIIAVNPDYIEGGIIPQNAEIMRIDPQDYELAIEAKKAEVAQARYNLKLEEGQQVVAQNEWALLKDSEAFKRVQNTDLALRKPHLEKARADLAGALAGLEQARLNLNRTSLTLPFNALVLSRGANLGGRVAAQETVAVLADTGTYLIQASIPVQHLAWLKLPATDGTGSQAVVYYSGNRTITGNLIKILGDLDEGGRMARVLIEVEDPLGLQQAARRRFPLLLGEYVRVEIKGAVVENVLAIERAMLHDNDTLWLLNGDRLEIAPADILWRGRSEIFINNKDLAGRQIVRTSLPAPVNGMQLRVENANLNETE